MDQQELLAVIERLDAEFPSADAMVSIRQPSGPDECEIHANRAGFARFGLELLRASALSQDKFDAIEIEARFEQFMDPDSDVNFCWFERHENLPESTLPSGRPRLWQTLLVVTLVGWFLLTFAIGGIVSIRWVVELVRGLVA